ncbi:hypothetical protein [Geodermatophilus sp. SYSU D00710]
MDPNTPTSSTTPTPTPAKAPRGGLLRIEPSLLDRAKRGDRSAIDTMFGQFLPPGETVRDSDYLGVLGMWGFGTHSFAAVTDRRIATLRVGLLGAVTYQDGGLEHVNSGVVVQPSRWLLYVAATVWLFLVAILGIGLPLRLTSGWAVTIISVVLMVTGGVLLLPLLVSLHYRFRKCGIVLWVREGVSVHAFADRKLLPRANHLYRTTQALRELRLVAVDRAAGQAVRRGDVEQIAMYSRNSGGPTGPDDPPGRARGIGIVTAGLLLVVTGVTLPLTTTGAATDTLSYGDDPVLDALWDDCEHGDEEACYSLYLESPAGSAYEAYGWTCAGRLLKGTDCTSVELE